MVDAWQWLATAGVSLHGAFGHRLGRATPHAVTWKVRSGLTAAELASVTDDVGPYADARDVFALLKEYMGSTDLLQPPLLVLPINRANRVPVPPVISAPRNEYTEDRRKELRSLALVCDTEIGLQRAARYLRYLACSDQADLQPPTHNWLVGVAVAPPPPAEPTGNQHFPHLPPLAWQLKVKFRAV